MILCYHAVNPLWRDWLSIPPARFAEHVGWLADVGTVPLEQLLRARSRSWRFRRAPLALTFDDGFADLHEHALPILAERGVPATVYLVASTLVEDRAVDWVDDPPTTTTLETLDLDQIGEMRDAGIAFGSHTWSHPDLRTLTDGELDVELGRSKEALEDLLGEPVLTAAYPRGLHNARVRKAAARAGYEFALSLPPGGPEATERFAVPRIGVGADDGVATLRLKAHPLALRARMSRAHELGVRGARLALRRTG